MAMIDILWRTRDKKVYDTNAVIDNIDNGLINKIRQRITSDNINNRMNNLELMWGQLFKRRLA